MPIPKVPKSELMPDDKMLTGIKSFVADNGFTADQVRRAYYRMLGDTDTETDSSVEAIRLKMQELVDDGFPVNRFVALIKGKEKVEDGVMNCFRYIDTLPVSDGEKRALRSIIERQRNGEVIVSIDNVPQVGFTIRAPKDMPQNAVALKFLEALEHIIGEMPSGTRYEISFIED